jgi:hypothetical protein
MGERLFTPKSLARVAEHVEWEDVLTYYRDGTTNQAEFMRALAILWERWMRGWSVLDFSYALQALHEGTWVSRFYEILSSMEERIQQLVGFYKGLWTGANPHMSAQAMKGIFGMPDPPDRETACLSRIYLMMTTIRELVKEEEETV